MLQDTKKPVLIFNTNIQSKKYIVNMQLFLSNYRLMHLVANQAEVRNFILILFKQSSMSTCIHPLCDETSANLMLFYLVRL